LELKIPVTSIGQPGSLSLMLFSMDAGGVIKDRLPNEPGDSTVSAFLTESTTPTPLLPANAPADRALATIERNTPVLIWRHNVFGYQTSTYFTEVFQDDTLTQPYETEVLNSPGFGWFSDYYTYWAPRDHYSDNESYHWSIKRSGFERPAANHFHKAAYLPTNLAFSPLIVTGTITYTNRTPSFSWQPAQSAPLYRWELWRGGVLEKNKETPLPYYTPPDAIEDGTYTWKVWARDPAGNLTAQAAQGEFSKVSEEAKGATLAAFSLSPRALVLRWQPVDFAAYYRVQIADDSNFSNPRTYSTWNTTFTPKDVPSAVEDSVFYVRVYMVDNQGHEGPPVDIHVGTQIYLPVVSKQ
jgi:hypothetical protein